jgi:4'-phosphopantetheinyl transferase
LAVNLYWLEQTAADMPAENDWLSPAEMLQLGGLRFPKRRGDWRLGRWTAKRAVAAHLNLSADLSALAVVEIRAAPDGAPEVFLAGQPVAITISLSHCAGTAICAVMPSLAAVGCDLERIEPRSNSFFEDYFTVEEQAMVLRMPQTDRPWLLTLLWSAKESALKALRVGLRADTRSVAVNLSDSVVEHAQGKEFAADPLEIRQSQWLPLQAVCDNGKAFLGWWRRDGSLMYTMVADPPAVEPILLEITQRMTY